VIIRAVAELFRGKDAPRSRPSLLSDHVRKDIGVSRADIWRQGRKPCWLD